MLGRLALLIGKAVGRFPGVFTKRGIETVHTVIQVHDRNVVKITRTHTSVFGSSPRRAPVERVDLAIRARLGHVVRALGLKFGSISVEVERGVVKCVEATLSLRPGEIPELVAGRRRRRRGR